MKKSILLAAVLTLVSASAEARSPGYGPIVGPPILIEDPVIAPPTKLPPIVEPKPIFTIKPHGPVITEPVTVKDEPGSTEPVIRPVRNIVYTTPAVKLDARQNIYSGSMNINGIQDVTSFSR